MIFKGATRVNFVENENRAQFIITLKLYKNCASEKCGVGYKKKGQVSHLCCCQRASEVYD